MSKDPERTVKGYEADELHALVVRQTEVLENISETMKTLVTQKEMVAEHKLMRKEYKPLIKLAWGMLTLIVGQAVIITIAFTQNN